MRLLKKLSIHWILYRYLIVTKELVYNYYQMINDIKMKDFSVLFCHFVLQL